MPSSNALRLLPEPGQSLSPEPAGQEQPAAKPAVLPPAPGHEALGPLSVPPLQPPPPSLGSGLRAPERRPVAFSYAAAALVLFAGAALFFLFGR